MSASIERKHSGGGTATVPTLDWLPAALAAVEGGDPVAHLEDPPPLVAQGPGGWRCDAAPVVQRRAHLGRQLGLRQQALQRGLGQAQALFVAGAMQVVDGARG